MGLIEAFAAETVGLGVDPAYRRWGGVALTSALLGRRLWTSITAGMPLYGNLYVAFVGDSGFGKSLVINAVAEALRAPSIADRPRPWAAVVPQDTTLEMLVLSLIEYFPLDRVEDTGRTHCVAMLADEIGVLFRDDANKKDLSLLQAIYDMHYTIARRRVRDHERNVEFSGFGHYFTALWGLTPTWLETGLPVDNIGLGWPARTHFVVGHRRREVELFGAVDDLGGRLRARLGPAIEAVQQCANGHWHWTTEARAAIESWLAAGLPGFAPSGELLNGYANRRLEHSAKLALVCAAGTHPERPMIEADDFAEARSLMSGVENDLPELFEHVGASATRHGTQRLLDWASRQDGWFSEADLRAATFVFFDPRGHDASIDAVIGAGLLELKSPNMIKPYRVLRKKR